MAIGGEVVGRVTVEADIDTSSMPGQLRRDLRKAADGADAQGAGSRWGRLFVSGVRKEVKSGADDLDNDFFKKIERATGRLPNILGRAFGKGSRNNFLNIIGSMVQGGANLGAMFGDLIVGIGKIPQGIKGAQDALEGFFDGVQGFFKNISQATGTTAKFGAAFGDIMGGVSAAGGPIVQVIASLGVLLAVVGSAGVIFLVFGEAISVAVAALSLLLGGVVAVAGAIGVGLVGALAVAAPLALALAAGIATVAVAFQNMSDKTKAQFKPLGDQFTKLGTHIADVFFRDAPKWVDGLSGLLKTFAGPTMEGVAKGVRDAFSGILRDFQSPAMTNALKAISDALGPIAGNLTTAFGKAFEGILAFMVPLLPMAQQLATSIANVATEFANWASSAEGQTAIKDFFTNAWKVAQDLWAVIVNVGGALGVLLKTGSDEAGAGFLGWLKQKTEELKTFLQSPAGQNKLQEWFAKAKEFGEHLWETLKSVGETLGKMDSPANRQFAINMVDDIQKVIEFIGKLTPAFEDIGRAIAAMAVAAAPAFALLLLHISGLANVLGGLLGAWGKLPGQEWARDAAAAMETVEQQTYDAAQEAINFPNKIKTSFEGDASKLHEATVDGQKYITTVDKDHNTVFLGSAAGLEAAASQANTGINGVPDNHNTSFLGEKFDLQRAADESRGAIVSVPNDKTSYFKGADSTLNRAVAQANTSITGVPDQHTTYFQGDISGILAKIATARAQISSLMAQSNGLAMGNADLGGASGMILGAAAGTVLKGPRVLLAGEDGPEAIVPLRRPLARVDPSVRGLSALAQGMTGPSGPSISVAEGAIQVTAPNSNPELVAAAVLDRLVARFA